MLRLVLRSSNRDGSAHRALTLDDGRVFAARDHIVGSLVERSPCAFGLPQAFG